MIPFTFVWMLLSAQTTSFFTTALAADGSPSFVGQKYFKDYTKELKSPSCEVDGAFEPIKKSQLTLLFAECSKREVLLLSKALDGGKENLIVHQFVVRDLKTGEEFQKNGPYCYFGKDKEKRISFVGVFKGWNATKLMTKKNGVIVEGWMVNPKTEKIEPVNAQQLDQISCLDESGGED
jgi:hypothetical protein